MIKKWGDYIKTKTIAEKISHRGEGGKYDVEKDMDIESKKIIMSIKVIK